jgi:hypothetical protein
LEPLIVSVPAPSFATAAFVDPPKPLANVTSLRVARGPPQHAATGLDIAGGAEASVDE